MESNRAATEVDDLRLQGVQSHFEDVFRIPGKVTAGLCEVVRHDGEPWEKHSHPGLS